MADQTGTNHAKKDFERGKCAFGCDKIVTPMHYSKFHGVKLTEYFSDNHRKEGINGRRVSCKLCRTQGDSTIIAGTHTAVAHLEVHYPDLFSMKQSDNDHEVAPLVSAEEPKDPQQHLLTTAEIVDVFGFMHEKRREAEAEVRRLTPFEARVLELEKDLTEYRDYVKLAEEDNVKKDQLIADFEKKAKDLQAEIARLAEEVRDVNYENQQLRRGVVVSNELRAVYNEVRR